MYLVRHRAVGGAQRHRSARCSIAIVTSSIPIPSDPRLHDPDVASAAAEGDGGWRTLVAGRCGFAEDRDPAVDDATSSIGDRSSRDGGDVPTARRLGSRTVAAVLLRVRRPGDPRPVSSDPRSVVTFGDTDRRAPVLRERLLTDRSQDVDSDARQATALQTLVRSRGPRSWPLRLCRLCWTTPPSAATPPCARLARFDDRRHVSRDSCGLCHHRIADIEEERQVAANTLMQLGALHTAKLTASRRSSDRRRWTLRSSICRHHPPNQIAAARTITEVDGAG